MNQQQKTNASPPFDTRIPDSIKALIGDSQKAKYAYLDYQLWSRFFA